jgi:hypothetical protein
MTVVTLDGLPAASQNAFFFLSFYMWLIYVCDSQPLIKKDKEEYKGLTVRKSFRLRRALRCLSDS